MTVTRNRKKRAAADHAARIMNSHGKGPGALKRIILSAFRAGALAEALDALGTHLDAMTMLGTRGYPGHVSFDEIMQRSGGSKYHRAAALLHVGFPLDAIHDVLRDPARVIGIDGASRDGTLTFSVSDLTVTQK